MTHPSSPVETAAEAPERAIVPSRFPARRLRAPIVCIIVALVVLAVAPMLDLLAMKRRVANLPRVMVPGEVVVELDAPGEYVVYRETRSVIDGRTIVAHPSHGPQATGHLVDAAGTTQSMVRTKAGEVYRTAHFEGRPIGVLDVDAPGTYVFRVTGGRPNVPRAPNEKTFAVTLAANHPGSMSATFGGACGGSLLLVIGIVWMVRAALPMLSE